MENPKCPYCGDEQYLTIEDHREIGRMEYYMCVHCGSRSPVKKTIEEAFAAAMDRFPEGRWEWNDDNGYYYCSECGAVSPREDQDGEYIDCPHYCHNCGADMRKEEKMSDNDLIRRMALYEKTAEWEAQALHMVEIHMHDEDTTEWRKWSTILTERSAFKFDVADAPAVPQEMSAREFLRALLRMYNLFPLMRVEYERWLDFGEIEKAVAIVERFAKEYPEERSEE